MRMEQYLTHTDYALWEVIVNGDAPAIASASAAPIEVSWNQGCKDLMGSNQGQSRVKRMILAAQSEAFKEENIPAERLHGLNQQMQRKEDESLYFIDRIWVPLVGGMRTIIMDEVHKTRYSVHPGADKMYHDL
ncbi:hypothetical protein Tco_0064218 [Tanacetum coccineum]